MREKDFLNWITACASLHGWRWWHVPSPMRSTSTGWVGAREAAGLCDLVMIHDDPPRLILAEVKGDKGKLSDRQLEFLVAAKAVADNSVEEEWSNPAAGARTIGVFLFKPGMETAIEQMLASRMVA